MDKKVIYVDFKAASKSSKHPSSQDSSSLNHVQKKKSFIKNFLQRLKRLFSSFRRNKNSSKDISRHKHWL